MSSLRKNIYIVCLLMCLLVARLVGAENTLTFQIAHLRENQTQHRLVLMLLNGRILVQDDSSVTHKVTLSKATERKVIELVRDTYGSVQGHAEEKSRFFISAGFQVDGQIGNVVFGQHHFSKTIEVDRALEFLAKLEPILDFAKGTLTLAAQDIFNDSIPRPN